MDRKQVKEILPVLQAFAEGKTIQSRCIKGDKSLWYDDEDPSFNDDDLEYRIKPESEYRPFKNAEECWTEMLKHKPFGWIKGKEGWYHSLITSIVADEEEVYINGISGFVLDEIMEHYTFADGAPFGVKEEE